MVGRPASPRPAGLGLAHLGLPFDRHLDPHVYEVHSGVPAQKISVSTASGSFNPCARPFGPFDQTNLQSMVWRQCEDVTSHLDQRHSIVCKGDRPSGLGEAGRHGIWPIFLDFW